MSKGLILIAPDATPNVGLTTRARANVAPAQSGFTGDIQWVNELAEQAKKEKALNRMVEVANATSDYAMAADAKREELAADPDYNSREAKFRAWATGERLKRAEAIGDEETRDYFLTHSQQVAQAGDIAVRAGARKDRRDDAVVTLGRTNDALVKAAGDAPNEAARAAILGQIASNLDEALKTNTLTAAEHKTMTADTLKAADRAKALVDMRSNPGGVAAQLATNKDYLPNLDPVMREQLVDKAKNDVLRNMNMANAQLARADLQERRAMAKMGDDAMKEIIDANEAGTLTDKFIQERRPYLNHTDYSAAIKLRRGGAENDSKDTLAAILPDLDTRDLKGSLTDALLANRITTATYKTLLERNQAALKDDQPQSPYKQGRDYIKQILDPSALGMGANSVMGGLAAQSRADALMEYDAWADAHKEQIKNDPQVATRYAAEVGQRYRLIDLSQNEAALGLPRFYQGGRGEMSEGTLKKAIADTQRAYDDGQLSAAEYAAQVRLLQGWDAVVKKRAGATAQIPGGPNGQGGNR